MSLRDQLLHAAKRAGEVLEHAAAKQKITEQGYTRINPVEIAEGAEVPVMVRPLEKLLGAFLRPDAMPGIIVNSQRPIGMVHLTCAHELGHYFLGHEPKADENLDYGNSAPPDEQAANQFAYSLLMPRWLIVHLLNRKGLTGRDLQRPEVLYQLSLRLGVSYTAIVWSLHRLKMLDITHAGQLSATTPKSLKLAAMPQGSELPTGGDVWVLDPRDQDCVLEPRPVDRFVLNLPNHTSAGYVWTADQAADAGFIIRPVLVDAQALPRPVSPVLVGNASSMQYVVEPSEHILSSGHVVPMALQEAQPWGSIDTPRDRFNVSARYESLSVGLSHGTRQRLIEGAV
jgi:Zn-dependent peptidase ImmA (M78 family)